MKIALDFDGVITDIEKKIVCETNRYFGRSLKTEDIFAYDIDNVLAMNAEDRLALYNNIFGNLDFLFPIADAKFGTEYLNQYHNVFILTKRMKSFPISEWLKRYNFPNLSIFWMRNEKFCEQIDVIIDDNPSKIVKLTPFIKKAFLFTQEWNKRSIIVSSKIERIYGWKELIEKIRGMDKK